MNNRQYSAIFKIGAQLLGTFGSSVSQAQARLRSLEKTAHSVAASIKHIWATIGVSLAGYAIGKLFKSAFEGAFEAAAEAQQVALGLTNEFWLHMRKQGYDAAAKQTEMLIKYNQELAKTGVLGRGVFDAMATGLSKIGLAPKEIAKMEPVLGGLLVRAKGIRATAADAEELANTFVRAAKGGRLLGLLKLMPIGPSERNRLKAYKDDWRGALQYAVYLASKYKDFNVLMRNTPLGQIQRMKNAFSALARDIGETMLPAQADMAAAWEKALPEIKPALIAAMSSLAHIMSDVAKNVGDFADRMAMSDATETMGNLKKRFDEIWALLGFQPSEGSFGYLLASGFVAEARIFNTLLEGQIKKFQQMKTILDLIGAWMKEAFVHPLDAAIHRLQDFISLATGGWIHKSKVTQEALNPPAAAKAAQAGPVMPQPVPTPDISTIPPAIAKDPKLLKAYLKGWGPPIGAMTPDVRHNVEKANRAKDLAAQAKPSVPYKEPPPPAAGKAMPAYNMPVSRPPTAPAMPTGHVWQGSSIPVTGQPATVGGGLGSPGFVPTGATSPYGGGGGGFVPAGASGGGGGGGGGSGTAMPDTGAAAKAQQDIAAAAKAQPTSLNPKQQKGAVLYGKLLAQFRANPPQGVPPDAARFGITKGTPEEWARWGVSVAHAESGFNPKSTNLSDPGGSFGVFQYAHSQAYGNAYDVDNSVRAFVRDVDDAAKGNAIKGSILARRFSTIGKHPDVGTAYLGGAERIAQSVTPQVAPEQIAAAQQQADTSANAPPPLLAANAYADGGIAKTPQIATLAEKGPEMVLPMGAGQPIPTPLPSPPVGAGRQFHVPEVAEDMLKHGLMEKLLGYGIRGAGMAGLEIAGADIAGAAFPLLMHPTTLGASNLSAKQQVEAFQGSIANLGKKSDPESQALMSRLASDPDYAKAKSEVAHEYNMTHNPTIHIHGNADEAAQSKLQIQLDDHARKFIQQFKDAQRHERRLSYESGHSS